MRVLVTASARFAITDGNILWCSGPSLGYHFWTRYLDVYDEVQLMVRAKRCALPPEGWVKATGPNVRAVPLPYFEGPWQFARVRLGLKRVIRQALFSAEAIQLRLPCTIGTEVVRSLEPRRPYGAEIVGDPYDVFAPGSVKHPLRPFLRWWFTRQLRQQCVGACATAYVTQSALQRRYPSAPDSFATHFSSVTLTGDAFVTEARPTPQTEGRFTLITVGSLAHLAKGPDILIEAVSACVRAGLDLQVVLVGGGQHRSALEWRAAALGLDEQRICFTGNLPAGEPVRILLDQADLFVLPSRVDGLPRAMIEAMARALPCIGSTVGGIPELLPDEDLVPPDDAVALARKIREVVTNPARMARMSSRNLDKAREYHEDILRKRRTAFYQYVREKTAEWLKGKIFPEYIFRN